ncbi:hypothetical protein MPLB_1610003 [Mesorhizobium sp. ORS 3324]|nr:hypothetical protein MPLB_1610003 [Mesorhizobium sp. ORS 3324]
MASARAAASVMKDGVGRSPSPAQSGIRPSRKRPCLTTATMPLSGAARASVRKVSMTSMADPYFVFGALIPDSETKNPGRERPGFWSRASVLGLFLGEQVADFGKQRDVGRRRRGGGSGLLALQLLAQIVHGLDHEEDNEGKDQKIQRHGDEIAIGEHGALLSRVGQVCGGDIVRQTNEVVGKVDASKRADERHDDVVDQRIDDFGEGSADDDADGQVHHIALGNEFLKFFQHSTLLAMVAVLPPPSPAPTRVDHSKNPQLQNGKKGDRTGLSVPDAVWPRALVAMRQKPWWTRLPSCDCV